MTMPAPILAQQIERPLGQRHITVSPTFAVAHMHHLTRTINVFDLQVHAFPQAQATRLDRREADAIRQAVQATQDLVHFGNAEDDR